MVGVATDFQVSVDEARLYGVVDRSEVAVVFVEVLYVV
jgi:hypothetical protein